MSPLRRDAVIALGGIVKSEVVKALEAEATRRGVAAVSAEDISSIAVPEWLYAALVHIEALPEPTILGRPLSILNPTIRGVPLSGTSNDTVVVNFAASAS